MSYQTSGERISAGVEIVADRYIHLQHRPSDGQAPPGRLVDFIHWLTDFEYGRLGLPQPDLVIYLDMHPETSRHLLKPAAVRKALPETSTKPTGLSGALPRAALYAADFLGWQVIRCCDGRQPFALEDIADAFLKYMSKADNGGLMIVTRKIELSAVRLEDKRWIDELLSYSDFQRCEYCFANLFNWRNLIKQS